MTYVEENYPSFKHDGKREHKIPKKLPGTYVDYRCQLSNSQRGNCYSQIFHEYLTKSVVLKIKTDRTCKCSDYKRVRRGLGSLGKTHFEDIMKRQTKWDNQNKYQ